MQIANNVVYFFKQNLSLAGQCFLKHMFTGVLKFQNVKPDIFDTAHQGMN